MITLKANAREIEKFLNDAYKEFVENEFEGVMHIDLYPEYNLSLAVGWGDSWEEGEYIPCAKICVFDDLPDYDWAEMPWFNSGDVFDTETSLGDKNAYTAEWFVKQAREMVSLIRQGQLTSTYMFRD